MMRGDLEKKKEHATGVLEAAIKNDLLDSPSFAAKSDSTHLTFAVQMSANSLTRCSRRVLLTRACCVFFTNKRTHVEYYTHQPSQWKYPTSCLDEH
jgi:hypothetical protein